MKAELLQKLREIGQSFWLDNLSRNLINSGELKRLIAEDGITGITSNPTIFQKAISGSKDYDASLRSMLEKGTRDGKELFLGLALEDISRAADLLWPVYQKSGGLDGFVSIEVSPDLAYDTQKTIAEARRLFSTIGKKNILVKVPGTKPGLPAIEQLTAEGVNVNVTLLFSVRRYEEIAEAYIRGLEKRARQREPIDEICSVASFFVSRVDTLVDKLLEARLSSATSEADREEDQESAGKSGRGQRQNRLRKIQRNLLGKTFPGPDQGSCPEDTVGEHGDQEPELQRHQICRRVDGPGFHQHDAGGDAEGFQRPWAGGHHDL